eukprot:CAMPEP_0113935388 /NCGR_PEP_ID=MMETSP1339-20121228/2538_1 /TAXON_ID=94617 /ORGANISM="Fibrocapsa japonica" /LENGTH=190 /DNA_ID=CAMNT_0000937525 /DNA_START=79 /DNA_END=651 /DNA_ORIENTATION=+ /assembly_acc=CAM_ASM_000762
MRTGVIRQLAHRNVNWASLAGKVTSDAAKTELAKYRSLCGKMQSLVAQGSVAPAAVDFDTFRSRISAPGLVDSLEATYKDMMANSPVYSLDWVKNVKELPAELQTEKEALEAFTAEASQFQKNYTEMSAMIDSLVAEADEELAMAQASLDEMESARITVDTCTSEVLERYPEIQKEIEEEINEHKWSKDV